MTTLRRPWTAFLTLFLLALVAGGAASQQSGVFVAAVVQRTLVYHQITAFQPDIDPMYLGAQANPILSGDANRIVFSRADVDELKNHTWVVNWDGTDLREVDTYVPLCFCANGVEISDNGGKVISTDAVQIRVANADGTGKRTLITLTSNEIWVARLTGDGSRVYFAVHRDTATTGGALIQRGIWRIKTDGTGLQQVVTPAAIAATLGLTAGDLLFFGQQMFCLDVNDDGSKIVLVHEKGNAAGNQKDLWTANGDGTNLRRFNFPNCSFILHASISGDGSRLGATLIHPGGVGDAIVSMDFDGGNQVNVVDTNDVLPANGRSLIGTFERLLLSRDGSKMLLGGTGFLCNTDGSGYLQLGIRGVDLPAGRWRATFDSLPNGTMASDGRHFAYVPVFNREHLDPDLINRTAQLATVEINPTSVGTAPAVTNAVIQPPFIVQNGSTAATVAARATGGGTIFGVCAEVLYFGKRRDFSIDPVVMSDEGTLGDPTAGDKNFTNNNLRVSRNNDQALLGPRTVRIQADSRVSDGRRQATALDVQPLEVVEKAPAPTILNLHPRQARRGSTLLNMAIEGTNFFADSTVRFLRNGAADPDIAVSSLSILNSGKLVLTAAIDGDTVLGNRVVQVTNIGGSSTATADARNTFTVTDVPDPADVDPPGIRETNTTPTTLPVAGGSVTLAATVTDNRDIRTVFVEITRPNGTKSTVNLALQAGSPGLAAVTGRYSGTFAAPANTTAADQVYRVAFFAKDSANNQAGPVRGESFGVPGTVPDTDPPAISGNTVTPAELEDEGGTVNFSATVRDNVSVASARVRITKPDNTTQEVNLTRQAGSRRLDSVTARFTGSFSAPANTTTRSQRYRVTFLAKDGAGNETGVNGESIIVLNCTTPPVIVSASVAPTSLPAAGGTVTLNARVTSCHGNPTVLVQLLNSKAKEITRVTLTHGTGESFSGTARLPANKSKKKAASYGVLITATDSVGKEGPQPVGVVTVAKKRR